MPIDVLYDYSSLPEADLVGILKAETVLNGVVNNLPLRRRAVPHCNIDLYKSNNRRLRCYVRDGDLNIIDLTGAVAVFTVKESKNSTTTSLQKSTSVSGEGQIGSADEGECFFFIVPSDTSGLSVGQYVYDVKVTLSSGKVYTVVEGVLNLLQSVG